jgi:HAD superfamily hydrolase (TIGR01484 family)
MNYCRLVVLDVDGVLAQHSEPIGDEIRGLLTQISRYSEIALASGKPAPYLDGLARGIGLINTVVIGENGGAIYIPKTMEDILFCNRENIWIKHLKYELNNHMKNRIRYQQNIINITIFPKPPTMVKDVERECRKIIDQHNLNKNLKIFEHADSIDKSWAIEVVSNKLKIPICKIIAVGDGINDIGMLKKVKDNKGISLSVGLNSEVMDVAEKNFRTGYETLKYILELLKNNLDD